MLREWPGRDGGKGTWERHACSRLCELVSERGRLSREVCRPAQTSATSLVKTASTINAAHVCLYKRSLSLVIGIFPRKRLT